MLRKKTGFWLGLIVLLALTAIGSNCGSKPTDEGPTEKKAGTPYKTTGNEGTISGKITYAGAPIAPVKIDTSADPVCSSRNPNLETEDNVIKDGKLANVFVYIKEGTLADNTKISDLSFPVPSDAVTLDQNGCHYVPHVIGIQVNQKLKVTNSDPTQHNIHPAPKNNEEWNQTQASGAAPIEQSFKRAEVLVPVKCNQHPWMKSYIGVLKHPYFAVSAADGSFTIKGVPPGNYTLVAWHEAGTVGTEQTKKITVSAKGSATADFSFGGSATGPGSSLEMVPAVQFPMVGHH